MIKESLLTRYERHPRHPAMLAAERKSLRRTSMLWALGALASSGSACLWGGSGRSVALYGLATLVGALAFSTVILQCFDLLKLSLSTRGYSKVWRERPVWALQRFQDYHVRQEENRKALQQGYDLARVQVRHTGLITITLFLLAAAVNALITVAGLPPSSIGESGYDLFMFITSVLWGVAGTSFIVLVYRADRHSKLKERLKAFRKERKLISVVVASLPDGALKQGAVSFPTDEIGSAGRVSLVEEGQDIETSSLSASHTATDEELLIDDR